MRQQRKYGAERAFGSARAARKVQDQRSAGAGDVPSNPANAAAKGSIWSVPSALLPQQLGNARNEPRADSKRGLRRNVARGKPGASSGKHQGRSAGGFTQGSGKPVKLIGQHQRIEQLRAGFGEEPRHGRPGEVSLRTGKAAVADGHDDSGTPGESSGWRHISRIAADARNRAEDEKIERPASFCVWRFAAASATFTVAHPSQTNEPMPTTPPQIDPEHSPIQPETPQSGSGPNDTGAASHSKSVSVVPHEAESGAVVAPVRIRTNRYGELEEHELVHLLDTIEDERARARFRESIYISLFFWLAVAWVAFYGPRYLWHAPQLITPTQALQQQALIQLNAPRLPHHAFAPPPKIDRGTLAKLRAMEPKPLPTPAAPPQPTPPVATQPTQPVPSPTLPMPAAPHPEPPRTAAPVPDAPAPQPTKPSFNTPLTAGQDMQQAMRGSQTASDNRSIGVTGGTRGGAQVGQGVDILSDTQGVNFQPYLQRILREIYEQWLPLLPEETRPPLRKQGTTQIRFTINPDGTIAAMHLDGSTHDDALNRAAWGSITGVGQFPPLPKQFHGPNLELRIHYLVNQDTE
jgi:TonB family protein